MLPRSLALIDDDTDFSEFLSCFLSEQGVVVRVFVSGSDLLADHAAFDFDFYVIDLGLPGMDGIELLRILRSRTHAGVLVVSGRLGSDVFDQAITAGADMYLAKPVRFEQVALAIRAVQRRGAAAQEHMSSWKLDLRANELIAPDGARIELSEMDLTVMRCFLEAGGEAVTRETLKQRLALAPDETSNNILHATIYRLRRRIERATPKVVPLQSQSRVGYVFRATLLVLP